MIRSALLAALAALALAAVPPAVAETARSGSAGQILGPSQDRGSHPARPFLRYDRFGTRLPRAHPRPRRDVQRPRSIFRVAPDTCARTFLSRGGPRIAYSARCMQQSVRWPLLLPDACLREVRTHRGRRHVYASDCLRRAGWTAGPRN